jgi:hypothetical protein
MNVATLKSLYYAGEMPLVLFQRDARFGCLFEHIDGRVVDAERDRDDVRVIGNNVAVEPLTSLPTGIARIDHMDRMLLFDELLLQLFCEHLNGFPWRGR